MHELIINLITIDIMHSEVIKKSLLEKIFHANSKKKKRQTSIRQRKL